MRSLFIQLCFLCCSWVGQLSFLVDGRLPRIAQVHVHRMHERVTCSKGRHGFPQCRLWDNQKFMNYSEKARLMRDARRTILGKVEVYRPVALEFSGLYDFPFKFWVQKLMCKLPTKKICPSICKNIFVVTHTNRSLWGKCTWGFRSKNMKLVFLSKD